MTTLETLARDLRGQLLRDGGISEGIIAERRNARLSSEWLAIARHVQQLQREAWIAGRDAAAALEREIYFRLIGFDPVPCPCGNGRIPTGTYETATKRFAQVIRALEPPAQETGA